MNMRCRGLIASLLVVACSFVHAVPNDAAARSRLRSERSALQEQLDRRERDCIARAAPPACVDMARREHRAGLAPLRREEGALDAAQRRRQAQARVAARPSQGSTHAERAQREERSRQAYEARQRAAQAHREEVVKRQAEAASSAKAKRVAPLPLPAGAAPG